MPVGDDAQAAGFSVVPDSGAGGEVRLGAQEINRSRDYTAQVRFLIPTTWPVIKGGTGSTTPDGARTNLGFSSGTADASDSVGGAVDGNIYFKIVS
jgi:hypothetical protein